MKRIFLQAIALVVMSGSAADAFARAGTGSPPSFEVRLGARVIATQPDLSVFASPASDRERHLLVQPADPADPGWAARARAAGLELLDHVPDHAWFARVPAGFSPERAREAGLRWAGALSAADRVAPPLRDAGPGAWAREADGRVRLQVRFFADIAPARARALLETSGAEVTATPGALQRWMVLAPAGAIASLAARDEVRWIIEAPPRPIELNDGYRVSVRADQIQAAPYFLLGNGIRVGFWDTGEVDGAHPDFAGRLHVMESSVVSGHSTHVAGTLAGSGAASASHGGSTGQWKGVAPAAHLWTYDFYNDPVGEHDGAINAQSVDVSQNSWGYSISAAEGSCAYYGDYVWNAPEFDAVVTGLYGRRIPIIFAVGNERDDGDCGIEARGGYACIAPPATAKNILTVGAIQSDGDAMTAFSSWGPTTDGRIRPDLVAPGCQASGDGGIKSADPGGGYLARCGTSMAAPGVSGCVGLVLEEWRLVSPGAPAPWPSTLKSLLVQTARDLGTAGPDYGFGFGAIDSRKAVDVLRTQSLIEDSVSTGASRDIAFYVPPATGEIRVVLAWDDPPASDGAAKALVNDLDLVLIDPALGERRPLVLDPATPAAAAVAGVDSVNNVEEVVVSAPPAGTWTCRVTGTQVPVGPQRFSIAGLDLRAPADVNDLALSAVGDSTIQVRWTNPGDLDFAATMVVRSDAPVGWTPDAGASYTPGTEPVPGVRILSIDPADHSVNPVVDPGRPTGSVQHYRVFAFDRNRNYAAGRGDSIVVGSPVPVLVATSPEPSALAVPKGADVAVSFNLPMDAASFDSVSFRVTGAVSGPHAGLVTLSGGGRVVSLDPAADFAPGEVVRVVVTNAARSDSGYAIAQGIQFDFTVDATGTGLAEFSKVQEPVTGAAPTDVRAADLDGDGDADGLVANRTAGTLTVLRNANGLLSAEAPVTLGAGSGFLATGDLDGDGRIDAVASLGASNAITVLLNTGGTLAPDSSYALSVAASGAVIADLNLDGRADVALSAEGAASVLVLRNLGGGVLAPPVSIPVLLAPRGIACGDVDGDRDPDLVVCCANANAVRVLANQGNGSFLTAWTGSVLGKPSDAALADFDGDGDLDLAVLRRTGTVVDLLWNNGAGAFFPGTPASYTVGSAPWNIVAFDADEDHDLDLGITLNGASSLAVLRNQGAGSFGGLATWALGSRPVGLAAAELTGDGDVDLLVSLTEATGVGVMHNLNPSTGVATPGAGGAPSFLLYGSRENPFRHGESVFGFSLDRDRAVTLTLYDVEGRAVRTLADGLRTAGYHEVRWDGRDVNGRPAAPGIYFLRLVAGSDVLSRKQVIAP